MWNTILHNHDVVGVMSIWKWLKWRMMCEKDDCKVYVVV